MGDPDAPDNYKTRHLLSGDSLVAQLGVADEITESLGEMARLLASLTSLVLLRAPSADEMNHFEGRGAYYGVFVGERMVAAIYVKGIGCPVGTNEVDEPLEFIETELGRFPVLRQGVSDIFFDNPEVTSAPRIGGTDTVARGALEMIHGALIFAGLVDREGWRSFEEVIAAGCTIPLNLEHFPELTERYATWLREAIAKLTEPGAPPWEQSLVDSLSWVENSKGLGASAQLVPGTERIVRQLSAETPLHSDANLRRMFQPGVCASVGRTLRALADLGFLFSRSSQHGQNLYTAGRYNHADNSDKICLGVCRGARIPMGGKEVAEIPARFQQVALLCRQLDQGWLLTPPPHAATKSSITTEEVLRGQREFWSELLRDEINPRALELTAKLMPYLRPYFTAAAAELIVDANDAEAWKRTAKLRDALIQPFASFGVRAVLEKQHAANFSETWQLGMFMAFESRRAEIDAVKRFLRTGDSGVLRRNRRTRLALELREAVDELGDPFQRDQLREVFARACGYTPRSLERPRLIYASNPRLDLDAIISRIRSGKVEGLAESILSDALAYESSPNPVYRERQSPLTSLRLWARSAIDRFNGY